MKAPRAVLAVAFVAVVLLALPLAGLAVRTPWSHLLREVTRPEALTALRLSLVCATAATALALLLGVPLAALLAEAKGGRLVRGLVLLPLVLPPVVGGVALLAAFGRRGLLGAPLARLGVHLPFTTAGAVLAETFVALPLVVVAVEGGLRALDPLPAEAAATLGAGPWRVFRTVTLPAARTALLAGGVLAFARALGEFGATVTFAGNLPGRTQTVPLAVYLALEDRPATAYALSALLVAVSLALLVGLRSRWLHR